MKTILKSEIKSGNTVIAAAAQIFGVRRSIHSIKVARSGNLVEIKKDGSWSGYKWIEDSKKFVFTATN